jgi:SagB-type dehydrogenase family enzyme
MIDKLMLDNPDEALWELFHENSKLSQVCPHPTFKFHPRDTAVIRVVRSLKMVHPFTDFPKVTLPAEFPTGNHSFEAVLRERQTAREFESRPIQLGELAKILFFSYGITFQSEGTCFPADLRTVPSGGALYPLEIYLFASRVNGLKSGLYHFNPTDFNLDVLKVGDEASDISESFVQPALAKSASAILLIGAFFARSAFKYGDRAYRFVFLEAGHLCQNALLTAQEIGLGAAPIGGFFDRQLDRHLGFDGVNQSVIYSVLVGHRRSGR